MAAGKRLTEAAHGAGFADSAHFSRTFQRMFGLPATALDITPPGARSNATAHGYTPREG